MQFKNENINGLNIFYREAGSVDKPVFLLLHGFPSASHMFRNLIPILENDFHIIAPDYVGFGQSAAPEHTKFNYSFENLTNYVENLLNKLNITKFYMYVFDYGAPIGFNLAVRHPDQIQGIVSQNGNVYQEGLGTKWEDRKQYWAHPTKELREKYKVAFAPETIKDQYMTGEKTGSVGPDGYTLDIHYTESSDYAERQSDLIFDYQNNVANYPKYQAYLRQYQPKLLAVWGKNDPSFIYPGAEAFKKDDPNAEIHLLDGGHFVLETHWKEIGQLILKTFANTNNLWYKSIYIKVNNTVHKWGSEPVKVTRTPEVDFELWDTGHLRLYGLYFSKHLCQAISRNQFIKFNQTRKILIKDNSDEVKLTSDRNISAPFVAKDDISKIYKKAILL